MSVKKTDVQSSDETVERGGVHIFRAYIVDPSEDLNELESKVGGLPQTPARADIAPLILRVYAWYHALEEISWQPLTHTPTGERTVRRHKRRPVTQARHELVKALSDDDTAGMRASALRLLKQLHVFWQEVRDDLYAPHARDPNTLL